MPAGPAYRIETERLVIRCYEPRDAPLLKAAVDASVAELRQWMPWASSEPETIDDKLALIRTFRGQFDLGRDFVLGIFDLDESRLIGGTGLHLRRGPEAREIGYWIATPDTGRGYATEAAAALTRVAFEIDEVERVEIHVDPGNERSLRIPRALGFAEEATLRGRARDADGAPRDLVIFSLFADRYATSPCAAARLAAFDAMGRELFASP